MSNEPIFQTKILFWKTIVYPDRIYYKAGWSETTIMAHQIALVKAGLPFMNNMVIETSGGAAIKMLVSYKDKKKLVEAIHGIQQHNKQ